LHTFDASHPASPVLIPTGSTDEHTYTFNALNRPAILQQQAYTYTLSYGLGEQRIHTRLENNNNLVFEMPVSNSKISM
jgi:hypothetical protein